MYGVMLRLCHPKLPSCDSCQKYSYDEEWKIRKRRRGRTGLHVIEEPVKRGPGEVPPCSTCPKIPEGVVPLPANAVTLSPENEAAFFYWQACRQDPNGEHFDRDELTIMNNVSIQQIVDAIDRQRMVDQNRILLSLAKVTTL
jgi:hypothetical protein